MGFLCYTDAVDAHFLKEVLVLKNWPGFLLTLLLVISMGVPDAHANPSGGKPFDFENCNWSMTVAEVADAEGLSGDDFTDIGWSRGYLEKAGYAFGHPCVMTFNFVEDSFTEGAYAFISEDPMGVYQVISGQIAE